MAGAAATESTGVNTLKVCILFLGAAGLVACDNTPTEQPVDFERLFAEGYVEPYNAKDIDRWLTIFADDAVGLHDGLPPLEGRDAIRGFGEAVRDNFDVAEISAQIDEVRRSGNWAWTRGRYESNFVPKPGTEGVPEGRQTGKFLLIWERQDDGNWLITLDMGNSGG